MEVEPHGQVERGEMKPGKGSSTDLIIGGRVRD
jgi:hypothetical protein